MGTNTSTPSQDLDSQIKTAKEYHLSRWNTYHDAVKDYNQLLSSRFSGIFTLLTSAWVIISAIGSSTNNGITEGTAANLAQNTTNAVTDLLQNTAEAVTSSPSSTYIIALTLVPILLTLLLLHEMRIFIQFQQDNYLMIYHAYKLYSECDEPEFRHVLDVTQGSGTPVATFIFMVLSNVVVLFVPIINIIQMIVMEGHRFDNFFANLAIVAVNVVCCAFYIIGAAGSGYQYLILCRKVPSDLWYFAVTNNMKLTGAKIARPLQLNEGAEKSFCCIARRFLKNRSNPKNSTLEIPSFTPWRILKYFRRLNSYQRKALLSCIYSNWFSPGNEAGNSTTSQEERLPYVAFFDVTTKCNLHCEGCYAGDIQHNEKNLDVEKLHELLPVLKAGGVKAVVLTGGEPTLWEPMFKIILENPDLLFFIFTNGQKRFDQYKNIIPKIGNAIFIFSVDGDKGTHDERRGVGTYDKIMRNLKFLRKKKVGFAISMTVTAENYANMPKALKVISHDYKPAFAFFFRFNSRAYQDDNNLCEEEYEKFCNTITKKAPCLVINLPHDEQFTKCGDCVAGKYIFHIRHDFRIGRCPYIRKDESADNLSVKSIRDALDRLVDEHCPAKSKQAAVSCGGMQK